MKKVRRGGLLFLLLWPFAFCIVPSALDAQAPAVASCTPAQVFARMTPAQRVGQLFMVGLKSGVSDDVAAQTDQTITELHAGNVVLYGSTWNAGPALGTVTDHLTKL